MHDICNRCSKCGDWRTYVLTKENAAFVWEPLPNKKEYIIIVCIECRYEEIKEIEDAD